MTQEHNYRIGFALMSISVGLDALGSLLLKHVIDAIDPLTLFFWRALISAAFLVPYTVVSKGIRWRDMKTPHAGLIIFAAACLTLCVMAFIYSLLYIPIAASYAINQSAPLMVAALAVVLLRDRISGTHWLAVIAGMVGTLVIIEPWSATFNMWSVWVFLATVLYAIYLALNSWLSTRVNTAVIMLYGTMVSLVMSLPFAFNSIASVTAAHWLLIAVLALGGLVGRYTCIAAFKHAPASYLTPLEYLSVPLAAVGGWLIYTQELGPAFFVGTAITIAAGLYIFYTPHHVTRGAKAIFDKS